MWRPCEARSSGNFKRVLEEGDDLGDGRADALQPGVLGGERDPLGRGRRRWRLPWTRLA